MMKRVWGIHDRENGRSGESGHVIVDGSDGNGIFNPMGTGGGLFRPRVIKMLAISKPMIQLPWFFLTFPQLMNTTGLPKKIFMHFSDNFMLFHIILWS